MLKKILSVILSVVMIFGVFAIVPFHAFAETSGTTGDCTWTLSDDGVLTISGNGKMCDYGVYYSPSSTPWERERYITDVIIEDGVTSIGSKAFSNMNLTDIDIPDSVKYIGWGAFKNCGLLSVSIPDSVVIIGEGAFSGCTGLTSVDIPDSVVSICGGAFCGCTSLTHVDIPDSVMSIGDSAFSGCTGLTSVKIPDSVQYVDRCAFKGCTGLTHLDIPDSVVSIGDKAFDGCSNLSSVTIPDSVISIVSSAFDNTAWYNNQPDGVVYAGKVALKYKGSLCPSIIAIKNGTLGIAEGAFDDRGELTNLIVPDTVICVGGSAFWGTTWFNNQLGFSYAGKVAYDRNLTNPVTFSIPDGTLGISDWAFGFSDALTSITIPDSVTNIGEYAFIECENLTSVEIPDSVITIGNEAFYCCVNLKSAYIGNSITVIREATFGGCDSLKSIVIPSSVKLIEANAFEGCEELTDIYYPGSREDWDKIVIDNTNGANDALFRANVHCSDYTVSRDGFNHDLKWFAKNWNSTKYNPELAHLMMTMSELSYSLGESKKGYKELGLKDYDYKFYFEEYADYGTEKAPFNIGWTSDDDGTICILISIKGSGDIKDFAQGFLDWMGNASVNAVQKDDLMVNENFYNTMQNVYDEISKYYDQHFHKSLSEAVNTKLFITGHSRGAAVANFLEIKLGKEVGKENVYGYNFAVPDTVVDYRSKDMQTGYENIFNISNVKDEVSFQPGLLMHQLLNLYFPFDTVPASLKELRWKKCGVTVWYSENGEKGAEIIKADDFKFDREAHMGYRYLRYMRQRNGFGAYFQMFLDESNEYWNPYDVDGYQIYMVCCPVDVELLDKNGKVIVSVVNNKVDYHGSYSGEAMVAVIGDEKAIAVAQGKDYSLRLVGSDTGTMDYLIGNVDMRGKETELNYNFTNVELTTGKQMLGKTVNILDEATKTITREEKLLLMDGQGNTDTEILANGEETDYNVKYILGDADNNGSIDIIDATFIQRKLADLDTPYTDEFLRQGDADGSGELDVIDVTMIQRYLVGLKIPYLVGTDVV